MIAFAAFDALLRRLVATQLGVDEDDLLPEVSLVDDLAADSVIYRSDVVIIVTDQNSHMGVRLARQTARRLGRNAILLARCGLNRFQTMLDAL